MPPAVREYGDDRREFLMHPLHDYVAAQLAAKLKSRRLVVWYDPREEFAPFIAELRGTPAAAGALVSVTTAGEAAELAEYAGSLFEMRSMVEPRVCGDSPEPTLIYLPGCERDHRESVLMELEKAGGTWEPSLRHLARTLLEKKYTLGVIDELLPTERAVAYGDLVRVVSEETGKEAPSLLKALFRDARSNDALLAAWLADDFRDAEINSKGATGELIKLLRARLGVEAPPEASLPKLRSVTARYLLAAEFRADLNGAPPSSLAGIATPGSKAEEAAIRAVAACLRRDFPDAYCALADAVEQELGLRDAKLPAESLGAIDTFRFEEHVLLTHCGAMIAEKRFEQARRLIDEREQCFWLNRDVGRRAQWEACRRMAELGSAASAVSAALPKTTGDADAWVGAYTADTGWYRLDLAQRRLESWVANLDDEPEERALAVVRRIYEDACHAMAAGFTRALIKAGWALPATLNQTSLFSQVVAGRPKPVAYFLVDALRFEMGVELAESLSKTSEVSIKPAAAALPSITPIGMAALQPGASGSFSVVEQGAKLGARIEDSFLPDLASRRKHAASRVPKLVDLSLDELLSLAPTALAKKIQGAEVVVVRSQEIDHAGETGFTFQARQVMDTVIDNICRATRKLAAAGVEQAVLTADHGHLFFAADRDEAMRTDAPGGQTIDLHRRCWIGRGGATPAGCVRVTAAALGYASDLEFVFPVGAGVFRAGGELAYHHGGPSLQESIIPVIIARTKVSKPSPTSAEPVTASGLPEVITNRIFSVTLQLGGPNLSMFPADRLVHPVLMSAGKQVGTAGVVVNAEFDRTTGCVRLEPARPATIGFLLTDESAKSLRIVVRDASTDAEVYRSPADIPVRLGM